MCIQAKQGEELQPKILPPPPLACETSVSHFSSSPPPPTLTFFFFGARPNSRAVKIRKLSEYPHLSRRNACFAGYPTPHTRTYSFQTTKLSQWMKNFINVSVCSRISQFPQESIPPYSPSLRIFARSFLAPSINNAVPVHDIANAWVQRELENVG